MLDQREEAIRQRERELAEQRRVLAEEYRLLRGLRSSAPAAAPSAAANADREGAIRHVRVRLVEPSVRFEPARPEGVWSRVKRVMLGWSEPAVEKN